MNGFLTPIQVLGMVVVGVVMLICYGIMPYIGGGILILFDYAAFGFRWIGASNPYVAWAFLGAAAGALIGLNNSLRQIGMVRLSPKVALWGASGFAFVVLMSFLYCHVMKPALASVVRPSAISAPASGRVN